MADGSEGIVISGIAVGTLLLAFCLITTFCVTRLVLLSTVFTFCDAGRVWWWA